MRVYVTTLVKLIDVNIGKDVVNNRFLQSERAIHLRDFVEALVIWPTHGRSMCRPNDECH